MVKDFLWLIRRDLLLARRQGGALVLSLAFFLIVVSLFPLGVGPEKQILTRISAGVLWVAALLSVLLSLDRLFQADFEDGSLDQLALGPLPLLLVVIAKSLAHWLTAVLPLVLAAPVLGLLLFMEPTAMVAMVLALLLGSPILTLIGAVGAALTVGIRRGGVLLSLLILPLYVPILIFGAGAVEAAATGLPLANHMMLLGGLLFTASALCPLAAAAALRLNLE